MKNHNNRRITLILFFLSLIGLTSFASINDYGIKEYRQPNGLTFKAWSFSDEHGAYLQTLDGYMIEKNQKDSYYYYRSIDKKGEFFSTNAKVLIDDPIKNHIRKYLLSTEEWRNKIYKRNTYVLNKGINRINTLTTCTLKIILVEFSDIKHSDSRYWPMNPGLYGTARANYTRYSRTDFTNMISSYNTYNTTSPDGEPVYGSMNDYYKDMSNNNFSLVAQVANLDSAGYPRWVNMGTIKRYYMKPASGDEKQIWLDAISYLNAQQGVSVTADQNTKIVVIYAGNMYGTPQQTDSVGLNPRFINDGYQNVGYVMSERAMAQSLGPYTENVATFAHIGSHCHEFGHVLGLGDHYGNCFHGYWSLMSQGNDKGSNGMRGNCPAPMTPIDRNFLGWLNYDLVNSKTFNKSISSSLSSAIKINSEQIVYPGLPCPTTEYYVIENRQTNNQDWNRFYPNYGLLVWRYVKPNDCPSPNYGFLVYLMRANGNNFDGHCSDSDVFPGSLSIRTTHDFTTTCNTKYFINLPPDFISRLWINSNVILSNISNSSNTMTLDISPYWYGTLSESKTMNGEIRIGEDFIVPSNLTLTLNPNTTLNILPGAKLIVNGTLIVGGLLTINSGSNVQLNPGSSVRFLSGASILSYGVINATGSSTDSITFTSSVPSERWGGIVLSGSGAGSSVFSYCKFNNVQTTGGSVLSFTNMTGNPVVQYCNISGNSNIATTAVVYSNSNGYLMKNLISYNTIGVSCNSGATPMFGRLGFYYNCNSGNNRIIYNYNLGVSASNSTPYVGSSGVSNVMGNSLRSNTSSNLSASGSSYLNAENVWWGSSTPDASKITTSGGATIQYNPWCTSEPQYKMRTIENVSEMVNLRMSKTENNNSSLSSEYPALSDPFEEAIVLIMNESYNKAFTIYKNILTASKEKQQIEKSLFGLLTLFRAKPSNDILDYLEQYGKVNTEMKPTVDYVIGNSLVVTDKTDEAIAKYQSVINDGKDPNMVRAAKIGLIKAYHFNKGEKELANLVLTELRNDSKSLAPAEEVELEFINWLINGKITNFKKEESQNKEKSNESKTPIGFSLSNYPNPFNPSTTIRYSIPQDLHVKLKVYDITGKEVAVLVNEMKQAGEYNVEFSAGKYASGVYYYKLEAGSYKNIQKMVLVK